MARTVRRFESVVGRLPRPSLTLPRVQGLRLARRTFVRWLVGGLLIVAVGAAVAFVHTDPRWFVYRETVQISGVTYLNADELYTASGIDSWNFFWLRSAEIRRRLLAVPYVQDVQLTLQPPNQVAIAVQEEQPVALWVTTPDPLWIMPDGTALPVQDGRATNLPQIIDPGRAAQDVTQPNRAAVDPAVLASAQTLLQQLPEIRELRYNGDFGLNFQLPGAAAWVYWGDGERADAKFANLAIAQQLIRQGEVAPQIIDVRYDRPYIR
jgi:cell division septal protein FtsQ